MNTVCLVLKAPREGTVKTRLAREIGAQKATEIYRALVEHQARAIPADWEVAVHFAPEDAGPEMEAWLGPLLPKNRRFVPQGEGDLGSRLTSIVRTEFQRGTTALFLVGGDCPAVSGTYLEDAGRRLTASDIVLGPAVDGGYVLLGLKTPQVGLFEKISWSTPQVLAETLAAAKRLALTVDFLATLEDVDDEASLRRQFGEADLSAFPR